MNNNSASMPPVYSSPRFSGAQAPLTPPAAATNPYAYSTATPKKSASTSVVIVLILFILLTIAGFVLAFYFYNEYTIASTDLQSQIDAAVLDANQQLKNELEADFEKRENNPYSTFSGPSDLGSVSFKYPKTWSVYIEKDGTGYSHEFTAYLHPGEVSPVSNTTINALRVIIRDEAVETTLARYKNYLEKGLTSSSVVVNNETATRFDGQISDNFVGSAIVFKVRTNSVTIQTDAEIYREYFDEIVKTITYVL